MSWKVAYKNLYGELESEVFDTRDQADVRYDELSRRCDLYWSTLRGGEDIPDTCDIDWVDEPEEVDEDGSSACALGAVPTGTFEKPRKDMKLKENEEFWINVAAPEYRGAPAPKFNPKAINEPRIPDGMRYKEYTWSEEGDGVILDWVTQETYTPEDREVFKAEVKRALKANGFKGKVQVNLNVRDEDDIETFVIDMGKNEAFNADRKDWANAASYDRFARGASSMYTILAFDRRIDDVLADYNDALKYIPHGVNGAVVPFLSKYEAEDLSEELTAKGVEHCVFKQTLEIA